MISKKLSQRCVLLAIIVVLLVSSLTINASAEVLDMEQENEDSLNAQFVTFDDLFEVSFEPDITDDDILDPGQDLTVTVTGRNQVEIEGDRYRDEIDGVEIDRAAMINVTNVLWCGTPWYDEFDDTVWYRNGTDDPFFERVSPHEVKLHIWSEIPDEDRDGYQFPPGCRVDFDLYVGNKTTDEDGRWVNRYLESQTYQYHVSGAFPHSPLNSPDAEEGELFEENIELDFYPEEPNIRQDVEVEIKSRSDVKIDRASLMLEAIHHHEGTNEYYQYFFQPEAEEWPSENATTTIDAEEFHKYDIDAGEGTEIIFHVSARDPHGNEVVSHDHSYNVVSLGTWNYPGQFERNIELTTDPDVTGHEPTVSRGESVEVTIESEDENVPIENAYLYYNITNMWHGVPYQGQWQMRQESPTKWVYEIPAQQPEVNVEFYIRAWDIGDSMIESEKYSYSIEEMPDEPDEHQELSVFYVTVYDAEMGQYVRDVRVVMRNRTFRAVRPTDETGITFPNQTGAPDTPQFLTIGETYTIRVYYQFEDGNETREEVEIDFLLEHPAHRNETEVLKDIDNLLIIRENDTIEFRYNSPPEPPEFAGINTLSDVYGVHVLIVVFVMAGLAIPIGWKLKSLIEEGQQERSLVK